MALFECYLALKTSLGSVTYFTELFEVITLVYMDSVKMRQNYVSLIAVTFRYLVYVIYNKLLSAKRLSQRFILTNVFIFHFLIYKKQLCNYFLHYLLLSTYIILSSVNTHKRHFSRHII